MLIGLVVYVVIAIYSTGSCFPKFSSAEQYTNKEFNFSFQLPEGWKIETNADEDNYGATVRTVTSIRDRSGLANFTIFSIDPTFSDREYTNEQLANEELATLDADAIKALQLFSFYTTFNNPEECKEIKIGKTYFSYKECGEYIYLLRKNDVTLYNRVVSYKKPGELYVLAMVTRCLEAHVR